jgi:hypothetical protein
MATKVCRECRKELSLDEFYVHPEMGDGHLNKCKECVKARVMRYREQHLDQIREYDRERAKLPHRKELAAQVQKRRRGEHPETMNKWRREHPEVNPAHMAIQHAVANGKVVKPECCSLCGRKSRLLAHHPDYAKKLHVIWVCPLCHKRIHPTPRKVSNG